jgi:hypothetical protein
MNRIAAALALSVLSVTAFSAGETPPATAPAAAAGVQKNEEAKRAKVEIPVRRVVLFTSGLGFFEHEGNVEGNVQMELACRNDEINDMLKSLVTQDTDGTSGGARYTLPTPADKMVKDLPGDIMGSGSIAEVLAHARGAEITVSVGSTMVTGKIMGVEDRTTAPGLFGNDTKEPTTLPMSAPKVAMLNLLLDKGVIRTIRLQDMTSFAFTDEKLQKGLAEALDASMHPVDVDHKAINVFFDGGKKRDVRLAYTVEAPVWKMSYRLILPEIGSKEKAKLQGWAIVENDTESDWVDVKLSMVGGRPLSFVENLFASYYIPRPVVQPRAIVPRDPGEVDDTGRLQLLRERFELYRTGRMPEGGGGQGGLFGGAGGGNNNNSNNNSGSAGAAEAARVEKTEEGFGAATQPGEGPRQLTPPNYAQGIKAMADVEKVGEHFQYDLGKVTVKHRQATMLPVMADPAEVERLSIYNPAILASHAMLGVKLVNTSDHYLLAGPVTVMESGKATSMYAGDARVADTPPGQKRWVSYAVDQDVKVTAGEPSANDSLASVTLAGGAMVVTNKHSITRGYTLVNRSKEAKTVIVETARIYGGYELVSPATEETTDVFYRFRVKIDAEKTATLNVMEAAPIVGKVELVKGNAGTIDTYIAAAATPAKVREGLVRVRKLWKESDALTKELGVKTQDQTEATAEEVRIRSNVTATEKDVDFHAAQIKKLQETEDNLSALNTQIKKLREAVSAKEEEIAQVVGDLKVE